MSTASETRPDGDSDHILRPRAVKPVNPQVIRAQDDEGLKPPFNGGKNLQYGNGNGNASNEGGRSTPLPPDAPPSAQSISVARRHIRAAQKRRLFPTIDYAARLSHFDPNSEYRDFRGFFALFWVGLAIMVMTTMLRNIKDTGHPMRAQIWSLFTVDAWQLSLSDLAMVSSTAVGLPLQLLFRRNGGALRWGKGGMAIQSLLQAVWLAGWVSWPFILDWTWTAQVFFTLHTLAILMKMHSYAFYNGHLSETERRLSALDHPATASKASAYRYPTSGSPTSDKPTTKAAPDSDEKPSLTSLREDLAVELTSPLGRVTYPQNLTLPNYVDYILCPTLCYELEYPRTERIRWMELMWKVLAIFGCIFLLTVISEEYILPVLNESELRLQQVDTLPEIGLVLAEGISMLLFPFMITFLLVFLVIFEYVLGALAEITRFADRQFYHDWWNSTDWLEFSREWNIPVHHFFRRHVYGASRPHLPRPAATAITFLISALAHELVMGCITKKFRGYGFVAMMLQLPIVAVQRLPWVKGKRVFNNVCFWCSIILGLSMMCALYVLV
ncbi:MAG: hypothetical protein M1832_005965 [Thelocarpon impressellum]|nr:MAG: hypothetical protein M1832_005965 [Thelocarpon impressellum]